MKQKTKRIAAYTVSGVTFLGAVTGLLVNMTRLGDSLGDNEPGRIQIMPTLIQEAPPEPEFVDIEDQHSVTYAVEQSDSLIDITFATSANNAPVKSVGILGEGPFFALPKVGIDIKMVNNTDEAIFVTDAVIEVAQSRPNTDPLMVSIQNDGIVGYLSFLNDGWGEPDSVTAQARIAGEGGDYINLPFETRPDSLIDATVYNFDIGPVLSGLGIDPAAFSAVRAAYDAETDTVDMWRDIQIACLRKQGDLTGIAEFLEMISGEPVDPADITDEQLGSIPYSCAVELEGTLNASWTQDGINQSQGYDFVLSVMVTPPDGLGAAGFQPTGAYDFKLRTEGENYTINVPISQPVSPAGFDRFVLWLGADKSSNHDLTIKLRFNEDGEIASKPVRVKYLRPRSTASSTNP